MNGAAPECEAAGAVTNCAPPADPLERRSEQCTSQPSSKISVIGVAHVKSEGVEGGEIKTGAGRAHQAEKSASQRCGYRIAP